MASSSSTFLLTGTTADVVALLTLGVTRAARKSGLPHSLAPAIAAGMLLWLGAAAILARSGVLSAGTASPPRWPLLPLTALATLSLLGLNPAFRRLLPEIPPWQPVALQAFRVGVELRLLAAPCRRGRPVQVTFEGRNFDCARRPRGPSGGGRDRVRPDRPEAGDRLEPVRPGVARQRDRDGGHVRPRPTPSGLAGRAVRRDRRLARRLDPRPARADRDLPPRRLAPPGNRLPGATWSRPRVVADAIGANRGSASSVLQVAGREILPKSFDQGTLRTTRSRRLNLPQIIPCASAEGPPCSGCAFRVERHSRMNRSLGWLWGQLDEFLGRQALVQPRTSHRHRLEGAMIRAFRYHRRRKWATSSGQVDTVDRWFLSLCNREATGRASNEAVGSHLQAGSSQPAKDGSDTPGMGGTRSIETRNKVHACMAHRWNKTKKQTVLRIRLGRDQGMSRCLVALSKRWKLALISRSVSSHRRAGNKTQNSSAALQTIVLPGTRQRRKRSCRRPGEQDSGALHSKRSKALPNQRSVPRCRGKHRRHSAGIGHPRDPDRLADPATGRGNPASGGTGQGAGHCPVRDPAGPTDPDRLR